MENVMNETKNVVEENQVKEVTQTETALTVISPKDIEIISKVTPAVLDFNFEQLESALILMLKNYEGLVVDEQSLKGCKDAKSELASFRTRLEEFRKTNKKEAESTIKAFDSQCGKLKDLVVKVEAPLAAGIDVFDEKEREKKRELAREHFKICSEKEGLREKFASRFVVKPEYANANASKKGIREDVETQVQLLKAQQESEDKDIQAVKTCVETENEKIKIKLSEGIFLDMLEDGKSLEVITLVIKKQAADIFEQENKVVEPEPIVEVPTSQPEAVQTTITQQPHIAPYTPTMVEATPIAGNFMNQGIPAYQPAPIPSYQPQPVSQSGPFQTQSEQVFKVVFEVTGEFSKLAELNNFIKQNGISYVTISQELLQ